MIPRAARLPVALFWKKRGRERLATNFFSIEWSSNNLTRNRIAIVIRVAHAKKATTRHSLKRRIAAQITSWPNRSLDILVSSRRALEGLSVGVIREEMAVALKTIFS
jgi:ribonuclease P protein component